MKSLCNNIVVSITILSTCCMLLIDSSSAQWMPQEQTTDTLPPSGSIILEHVRQTFPDTPIQLTADLVAKNKRGKITRECRLEAEMSLQTDEASAQYILSDAFGDHLSTVTITRNTDGSTTLTHSGAPADNASESVHASDSINGLDFSWSDLSFSFLWWTNATLLDIEQKLNRDCYIVEVIPPSSNESDYSTMKLWIDVKTSGLLQAEAYDTKGELRKKLQVKSLRKINGIRTIGDVETYTYPERTKTRLRIRDFTVEEDKEPSDSHQ